MSDAIAIPNVLRGTEHVIYQEGLAREKLEQMLERGRQHSQGVIQNLLDEAARRQDFIVPGSELSFEPSEKQVVARVNGHGDFPLTDHAAGDMFQDLGIHKKFFAGLQEDGEPDLKVANELLNDMRYRFPSRRLLRVVDGQVKGFLSEEYKPIDQREVVTGFIEALRGVNAFPAGGQITEWRYALDAIHNKIINPLPNEFLVMGVQLRSSDYGAGAVKIALAWWRVICENLAVGKSIFRQIHLGKSEWKIEEGFRLSAKTNQLSAQASVSAMSDAIRGAFSPNTVKLLEAEYVKDSNTHLDAEGAAKGLRKKGVLLEGEDALVANMVKTTQRIEILPQTEDPETVLRFKQALAWLANSKEGERRIALNDAAATLNAEGE